MTGKADTVTNTAAKWLALAAVVLLFIVIGLAWWVRSLSSDVDAVRREVDHLVAFTEEVSAPPSPEERAQQEAVAQAVALVPQNTAQLREVREILCEAFPDVTICASGG